MSRQELVTKMVEDLLVREGWPTYTNRAADLGGPTKGGITLQTLSKFRGRPASIKELQNLSAGEAGDIYIQEYIVPWSFILDDKLFEVVVDYGVNSGPDDPTRALQAFLGVKVDGIVGPVTRSAVNNYPSPGQLTTAVLKHRLRHVVNLAVSDRKLKSLIGDRTDLQIFNLRGWVNRILEFL